MKRKIWFFLVLSLALSLASSALAALPAWAEMSVPTPPPIKGTK